MRDDDAGAVLTIKLELTTTSTSEGTHLVGGDTDAEITPLTVENGVIGLGRRRGHGRRCIV